MVQFAHVILTDMTHSHLKGKGTVKRHLLTVASAFSNLLLLQNHADCCGTSSMLLI